MKTRNLFAAALIAALAFTACSNEDDVTATNDPNIVRFKTSVDGMPMTKATTGMDGAGNFDDGDVWGVYGKITTPESWPLDNSQYTVGTTTLYWDDISMDKPVTFSAYYPAMAPVVNPTAFEYDVTTAVIPDLLIATPVTASKGETVNLNFKHVMHQLMLNFTMGPGVPGEILDIKYTLLNMKTKAKVNLLDGTIDPSQTIGTTAYPQKGVLESFVCVAPQDLTAGADWIEIELDGKTYTCKVPANLNLGNPSYPTRLESGKQLSLTLTLKADAGSGKTAVTMSTSQISAWENMQYVDIYANE